MEEEVEVEFDEIAEAHPMWAEIVGADVCVLPAAFPQAPPPGEGMVGWRAEVQAKPCPSVAQLHGPTNR